ncbi:4'-phosphopantetheinyl transferase family protein [Sphingomonas oleivorans]|nr:4'-phosphopantetheinyl transferase superfamily protein [Sphingomonas oleivorans]
MERYAREADRIHYANAHGILRNVLGKALNEDGAALAIGEEAQGRPRLTGRTDLSFSIAHSRDRLAIALADRPCGVDVEYSEAGESDEIVAIHCFHPDECAAIAACPKAQRTQCFYAVWTRKEAVLKALGLGLTIDPAGFSVGADGEAARFDENPHAPRIFSWALDPIDGFQMALALASPVQDCGRDSPREGGTHH